ncbi:restriction endonuclease subunit S [Serratia sp. NFX21]|uniref:restriction endonuclease subunit S n=1 Tax=Serratia sp. NFX21 TaxID=3402279 RepID=UPI003AF3E9D4
MSFDFKRVVVSEVCELIVDCVNKTAPKVDYATPYKMIRTPNIRNGVINLDGCNFVTEDTYRKWTRRAIVRRDDVLLTREAPMGEVGIVDFEDEVFLGQRIMQYRADQNKVCPKFLFYSFLSSDLRNQFYQHEGSGSVVSHIRVPDCLKFEINLPPLETQKRITSVLWSLDQKIKNNSAINQTIEQMAQALFKSWFADFDPVKAKIAVLEAGGSQEEATLAAMTAISGKNADSLVFFEQEQPEKFAELKATAELFPSAMQESELGAIPEGWLSGSIRDVTEKVFSGGTPTTTKSEYWNGDFHWFSSGETRNSIITSTEKTITQLGVEKSATKKSMFGDVLIASAGQGHTRGQTALNMINTYINQSVIAVRPKSSIFISWLYLNLRSRYEEMRAISDSHSSRGSLTTKLVAGMPIVIPDENILQKFESSIFPFFKSINCSQSETDSLTKLRDTLLPKLLSGEITLPEAERAVSEAENV